MEKLKIMKQLQYRIYSLVLAFLYSFSVTAQIDASTLNSTTIVHFEQQGDSISLEFRIDVRALSLKSRHEVSYSPILIASSRAVSLPKVLFKGRNNYKNYGRSLSLTAQDSSSFDSLRPYSIIKCFNGKMVDTVLIYSHTLAYKPWMRDARLELHRDLLCACGDDCRHDDMLSHDTILLSNLAVNKSDTNFVAHFSEYENDLKDIDSHNAKGGLTIYFSSNSSKIEINDYSNREALRTSREMITRLFNSKQLTLSKIIVTGFSSIEGTYAYNKELSGHRAQIISDHLLANTFIDKSMIDIHSGGENWGELRELISSSEMLHKGEVLAIIDSVGVFSGREKMLMDLHDGRPYKYMAKHFFPQLRMAGYIRIYYDIVKDTVPERIHLQKAVDSGDVNARQNLEQILQHEQNTIQTIE